MEELKKLNEIGIHLMENGTTQKEISLSEIEKLYSLGYHHFEVGSIKKALKIFQTITALCPFYQDAILALGLCHFKLGQYDEAIRSFEVLLSIRPHLSIAHLYLGYCLIEKKEWALAKEALIQSIDLMDQQDPNFSKAQLIVQRMQQNG
jgi:tetratricopeptide (TPR) repeat protein